MIIGPFNFNPFGKFARFSPLDAIPKRDSEEKRVILNLSHPFKGDLVNSSITNELYAGADEMKLTYPSVEDLAKIVRKKGDKVCIFVRDLSKAYHQLFLDPSDIKEQLYFDVCLSMGSKSAAYCCQRTTNGITYIFKNKFGFQNVNYLDDLGRADTEDRALEAFERLGSILDK